jgi:oxygen-independent coproporphyrinogen-3 oxidase
VADYTEREPPVTESTPANLDEEKFFVGLRLTEGVRPSVEEWQRYEAPISRFLKDGLLERRGDTVRLTDRGVLLSNEVFQEFLDK